MKCPLKLVVSMMLGALGLQVNAATSTVAPEEHAKHHPVAEAAQRPAPKVADQMARMREMHQKMVAAKTPEER